MINKTFIAKINNRLLMQTKYNQMKNTTNEVI